MKWWPMLLQRRWLLLTIASAAVAGYWLVFEPPAELVGSPPPGPATVPARPAAPPGAASGIASPPESPAPGTPAEAPPAVAEGSADIFAVRTWEPPPPPVVETAPAPPPPPEAPPLPFRFLGKVDEVGKAPVFFLGQGEKILAVRPGDLIDGTYRVGRLEGGELHFLYRPLRIRQILSVGDNT